MTRGDSLTERGRLHRELDTLLEREVVNDPQRRSQVTDTRAPPYRWICHLDVTYLDPGERYAEKRHLGTGVLVSARHVLTAAHNLLSEDGRLKAVRVGVTPGMNGKAKPFGTVAAAKWNIHPSWFRNGKSDREFDYALLTLRDAVGARPFAALRNQPLGHWGDPKWGANTRRSGPDPAHLSGVIINVAGYPGDKNPGTQWRGDGRLSGVMRPGRTGEILAQDRLMLHTVDTHGGQSGGPVWVRYEDTGRRYLLGIHVAPASVFTIDSSGNQRRTHNLALRITDDVTAQIDAWM